MVLERVSLEALVAPGQGLSSVQMESRELREVDDEGADIGRLAG